MNFIQGIINTFVWVYVMILRGMAMLKRLFFVLIVLFIGCSQVLVEHEQSSPIPDKTCISVCCEECAGTGNVVYDENHILVINNVSEPGTYTCPICGGFGELLEEEK